MTSNNTYLLTTTDNNQNNKLDINHIADNNVLSDIRFIAETPINVLADKENLLVFPHCINAINNDIEAKDCLFHIRNKQIVTGNYLGFVGRNNIQISITSRFDENDNNFFVHYMLQKVFAINIFDLKFAKQDDSIWDFMIYLFPHYLKKALRQGIYKQYEQQQHNDARIRGTINLPRHIRDNIPFKGNIAYQTKEYRYDNSITQLIRHTIEYIGSHKIGGSSTLKIDTDTQQAVRQIISATPSYNSNNRQTIINGNRKPVRHPYYTEYTFLQQLCLRILQRDKLSYGSSSKDTIYGLIFDGAWLWEEYLNTILQKAEFKHPQNKKNKGAIYLFNDSTYNRYARYPDFYRLDCVLDAKYKNLTGTIDRHDMHQIITYLYISKASIGGFIFPTKKSKDDSFFIDHLGTLNGFNGNLFRCGVPIPHCNTFEAFSQTMKATENDVINKLALLLQAIT